MRRSERTVAYTIVGLGLLLGAGGVLGLRGAAAQGTRQPEPARLATCDVYDLVNRLVEGDDYAPARDAEQKRAADETKPLEEALTAMNADLQKMQSDLQAADPKDPGAQAKFAEFQTKRQDFDGRLRAYQERKGQLGQTFSGLVSGQFTAAYKRVIAEATRVARERGYTYVVAQKRGEIDAKDPSQLIEGFLSRPVIVAPDDADITEAVRQAMKLPTAPPPSAAGASPAAPAAGTSTPPATPPAGDPKPASTPTPAGRPAGTPAPTPTTGGTSPR